MLELLFLKSMIFLILHSFYNKYAFEVTSVVSVDSMDCSPPGSSVHGILQARILEWAAFSYCRISFCLKDQTHASYVSHISRQVFYHQHHLGSPITSIYYFKLIFIGIQLLPMLSFYCIVCIECTAKSISGIFTYIRSLLEFLPVQVWISVVGPYAAVCCFCLRLVFL